MIQRFIMLIIFFLMYNSYAQKLKATIHFRDGTSLEGYGYTQKNKIKFRLESEEEYDTWTDLMVKEIDFFWYKNQQTFRYVDIKNRLKYTLLKVIIEGEYTLYGKLVPEVIYSDTPFGFSQAVRSPDNKNLRKYYLHKKGEKKYLEIPKIRSKKYMRKLFNDCEYFSERFDDGEFKNNTLAEIVDYYNYFCID
ncbi:hypothetical protein [Dokdonia sp.]|uniref:hypothetical protein n=1 Tax=Dokdonia sp. TaxID=2024995 RepID=UPI003263E3AA